MGVGLDESPESRVIAGIAVIGKPEPTTEPRLRNQNPNLTTDDTDSRSDLTQLELDSNAIEASFKADFRG